MNAPTDNRDVPIVIRDMFEKDQAMREHAENNGGTTESQEDEMLDRKNTEVMKLIIERFVGHQSQNTIPRYQRCHGVLYNMPITMLNFNDIVFPS